MPLQTVLVRSILRTQMAPDTTAPSVLSATIGASGTSLTLLFDETVTIGAGGNSGLTLSASGGAATVSYASGAGTTSLVYSIDRTILQGETATRSYTQPGSGIEDSIGNDLVSFSTQAVTNNSTQSDTGVATLTGSGFGTNANYVPAKFMDFDGLSEGASWQTAGGTNAVATSGTYGRGTYTSRVTNTDGIDIGGGCWDVHIYGDTANSGNTGDGPFLHEQINFTPTDAVTVFKHLKIVHVSGPVPASSTTLSKGAHYKDTRVGTTTSNMYGSTTGAKFAGSHWYGNAGSYADSFYWHENGGNVALPITSADTFYPWDGEWYSAFMQGKLNSADGVADGVMRSWADGIYITNLSNIDYRDNTSTLFQAVQHNPGASNGFGSTGEWIVRHARIVVLRGLAWCAFGNSATFSSCTDLLVVEPLSWSDTQITFDPHGTRPSGYNWMYVMKTDGTLVSSSGSTSFSGA